MLSIMPTSSDGLCLDLYKTLDRAFEKTGGNSKLRKDRAEEKPTTGETEGGFVPAGKGSRDRASGFARENDDTGSAARVMVIDGRVFFRSLFFGRGCRTDGTFPEGLT